MSNKNLTIKCSFCGEKLGYEKFGKNKNTKSGYRSRCRDCDRKDRKNNHRSIIGLSKKIYRRQILSSKHRDHALPSYTELEFRKWMISRDNFKQLYDNWVNFRYIKELTPSADRNDDYLPYSLENLKMTTWKANNKKAHLDMKLGINNKRSKSVARCDLDGNVRQIYYSIAEASRSTNIFRSQIIYCCKGIYKTAKGYKWKYYE